jgi:hypothetical protein
MDGFSEVELALREWARRFLRTSTINTISPEMISERILELHHLFNDKVPSQYSTIMVDNHTLDVILLYSNNQLIGQIGGNPPNGFDAVYIPSMDINDHWNIAESIAFDLIAAGYPGCLGCGGSDATEPWDELASRTRIFNQNL